MATQVSRVISVASLGSPEKIGGSTILQTDGVKKKRGSLRDTGKWRAGWYSASSLGESTFQTGKQTLQSRYLGFVSNQHAVSRHDHILLTNTSLLSCPFTGLNTTTVVV